METISLSLRETDTFVSTEIFGQFIEHLGTCINGGIYDKSSPFSNANGIRQDVLSLVKRLSPPVIRFPGGTVMCIYHWEDHVGPLNQRKKKKNLIWGGELNPEFGTAEFISYCRSVGAEPMICVNMASGTGEEAANWVEYCNGNGDTYYANLRRSHGYYEPFNVRYWCIGNECYAEPDIGVQNDVNLYIRDAREFIKFMKLTDHTIELVIVGSDDMEGWNKPVLDALSPFADYFSYHFYASENTQGIYGPFICEKYFLEKIDQFKKLLSDYPVKPENFSPWYRFPPRKDKIRLMIDEWNIWEFKQNALYGLDMKYNWRDALWTASMINNFASEDSIKGANMAQLVNILAPILTSRKGAYPQTIFTPLEEMRKVLYGKRMHIELSRIPVITLQNGETIPALSVSSVKNESGYAVCLVNRSFEESFTLSLPFSGTAKCFTAPARAVNDFSHNVISISEFAFRKDAPIELPKGSFVLFKE